MRSLNTNSATNDWIDLRALPEVNGDGTFRVATLGPRFTSSEGAARYFLETIRARHGIGGAVDMHSSLDAAAAAVIEGTSSGLIVANAYSGVNCYYMDARLALVTVFVYPTPPYGLAGLPNVRTPAPCRIALHPACTPLLDEMVPRSLSYDIVTAHSTVAAAMMVVNGEVDLALTNANAAKQMGLSFTSHLRPIPMVWSLFVRSSRVLSVRGPAF